MFTSSSSVGSNCLFIALLVISDILIQVNDMTGAKDMPKIQNTKP